MFLLIVNNGITTMSNNTEETYSEPCQTSTMESSQKAPALSV